MSQKERPGRFQLGAYWLSQRGTSPSWCRTWFDERTRQTCRESLGTRDFEEAKELLARWYISQRELKDEEPDTVPLFELLDRYYKHHASRLVSADVAELAIRRWKEHFTADTTVADLTIEAQECFRNRLATQTWIRGKNPVARPYSTGYIRRVIGVGVAALHLAYEQHQIKSVPSLANITVDKDEVVRAATLTLEQMAAFLNACTPRTDHVWWWAVLSINTLGRPKAVETLSKLQVSWEDRTIDLNPPGRPQNKKRRALVPLTSTLLPWLRKAGPLLVAYKTKQADKPLDSIRQGFERVRDRAGLPKTITPRSIRRTMARELRRRKVPAWDVAGVLGHKIKGVSTTEDYAEFDPDPNGPVALAIDAYCEELSALLKKPLVVRGIEVPDVNAS